jgi:pyruvate/2-oxoglutarate dehydrogenase complex dihydrolipoamide acyltransferase (E2) component
MAQRTVVTLVDDLDGGVAEESISFGLDHVDYEIDLSAEHAEALRGALAPYVAAARRTGGRRPARATPAPRPTTSRPAAGAGRSRTANAEIRAWAAEHGVTLAERGRLPGRVIEAYEAGDPTMLPAGDDAATATPAPAPAPAPAPEPTPEPEPSEDGERRGRDGLTGAERETIRSWAEGEGIDVKPRGQLKKDLIGNYRAWEARR